MLENMFPRHVLEFIVGAAAPDASLGELAYQHEDVSNSLRVSGALISTPEKEW